jgi:hypothetical protein
MGDLVALSRPESIGDVDFAENKKVQLPTKQDHLPGDYWYHDLLLGVEGRLAITVATATAERKDSPYSLIEAVWLEG